MIERAISLFAAIPPALVHALDFFVTTTRAFVLLRTRNRNEGINLDINVSRVHSCAYLPNSPDQDAGLLKLEEDLQLDQDADKDHQAFGAVVGTRPIAREVVGEACERHSCSEGTGCAWTDLADHKVSTVDRSAKPAKLKDLVARRC